MKINVSRKSLNVVIATGDFSTKTNQICSENKKCTSCVSDAMKNITRKLNLLNSFSNLQLLICSWFTKIKYFKTNCPAFLIKTSLL